MDSLTEGAACTVLLAKEYIDNDEDLLIANSDQLIEYSSQNFNYLKNLTDLDAIVMCFNAVHPKWSFVKVNSRGIATEVAEKKPISEHATVGLYHWKTGKDYVQYAQQMIENNIRTNNEFYVCPVYNEAIKDGKKFVASAVDKMYPIGTPEDLDYFLNKVSPDELL